MTLNELTVAANNYTDENFDSETTLQFANAAISKINLYLKSTLPFFSDQSANYDALSDEWQFSIIVPYICWAIKMNDSSIEEAREFLFQYQEGLDVLRKNKRSAVPEVYQGAGFRSVYPIKQHKISAGTGTILPDSTNPLGQDGDGE